jgi:hypothetical protein
MKTQVVVLEQQCLTLAQKAEMWRVYKSFYHYTEQDFMERIPRNTHFSLYLHGGKIVGFTGLRIDKTNLKGRRQLLIYLGQTVIARQYRGQSLLPATCLLLALKYWKELLTSGVWCWYDALSYKAYLACAKCATDYYPSRRVETPTQVREMRDFVGEARYGDAYCARTGTVEKEANYLNDASVNIFEEDMYDPDVAFFAKANPHHSDGHGLLVFAPFNRRNVFNLAVRYFGRLVNGHKTAAKTGKTSGRPAYSTL